MKVGANPFWPHETDFPALAGNVRADVAVVGGGIAGVSSAYFLAAKGCSVALIEADRIASGATGASTGTLCLGCGADFQESIKLFGLKGARLIFQETKESIGMLMDLAVGEGIDCGLRNPGIITVARDEKEAEYLKGEEKASARLGFPAKPVDVGETFKAREFAGGVESFCGQMHPGMFAAALCRLMAERHGAAVYENTEVLGYESGKSGVVVRTDKGEISAGKLIVATNLKPFHGLEKHFRREDSVDVPSRPLGKRIKGIFEEEKIIQTIGEGYDLFYPWGDRVFFEAFKPAGIREKLDYYFKPEVKFELGSQWGDSWSKTKDMMPIFGNVEPDVTAAVAMGDQGIVMGFTCGRNACDLMDGKESAFLEMVSPSRFEK